MLAPVRLLLCALGLASLCAVVHGARPAVAVSTPLAASRSLLRHHQHHQRPHQRQQQPKQQPPSCPDLSSQAKAQEHLVGTYLKGLSASRFSSLWSSKKLPANIRCCRTRMFHVSYTHPVTLHRCVPATWNLSLTLHAGRIPHACCLRSKAKTLVYSTSIPHQVVSKLCMDIHQYMHVHPPSNPKVYCYASPSLASDVVMLQCVAHQRCTSS